VRSSIVMMCVLGSIAIADTASVEKEYARAMALVGRGKSHDALPLLLDAAEHGLAKAQHQLGYIYEGGEKGVPKDEVEAARWYAKAAALGNRASQFSLGNMYEFGKGVKVDRRKAYALYLASALQKFGLAEFTFGLVAEINLNDRKTAIVWLERAGAQGDGRAYWIAQWLKRRDTPHFDDEAKLGGYINGKVAAWMRSSTPTEADDGFAYTRYMRERAIQIYQSDGKAAGDRCRVNGMCY
jgi:TPR repeat protein